MFYAGIMSIMSEMLQFLHFFSTDTYLHYSYHHAKVKLGCLRHMMMSDLIALVNSLKTVDLELQPEAVLSLHLLHHRSYVCRCCSFVYRRFGFMHSCYRFVYRCCDFVHSCCGFVSKCCDSMCRLRGLIYRCCSFVYRCPCFVKINVFNEKKSMDIHMYKAHDTIYINCAIR